MKKKIALLCCAWSNYYVKDFIRGMQRATKDNNIDIYCFNAYQYTEFSGFPNYSGFAIFNLINYEDYDGVIILSDLIGNKRILEREKQRILKAGVPAITINSKIEGFTCIKDDNYIGSYELMNHLIKDHGFTDFAYIAGKEEAVDFAERYKAYRTALADNNIKINMDNVFTIDASNYDCAYTFITDFIKNGKQLPQVFVCANDLIALAVLKVVSENGISVPEQLKIVGYDDIYYAKTLTPAITTVKSNTEQVGFEAVNRVLGDMSEVQVLKIKSSPIIRETCGCESKNNSKHNLFALDIIDSYSKTDGFSSHMEHIEEIFGEATDVFTLLTNLELYLGKTHIYEGTDFCVFLKSDWSSVLINSEENLPQNLSFGEQVQSIVSVVNNKKFFREMISTKDLMPAKLKSLEVSSFYFFLPIYNHSYMHGYLVSKNSLSLIDNHYGYTWSRCFGTNIERFRKKNMYKQMSQQFLKLSTRDALSGAINRVGLEKLAKPFYAKNKSDGLTTVLFFVDINKMKYINDQFGHLHGDLAVKTIAAASMEVIPKNWLCIRYGGDEFLILGNSKNYNGEDYCTLIKQRVAKKTSVMKLPYNLSASVGTYSVPPNSPLTLEQAVEKVDEIMYEQKQEFHKQLGDR